MSLRIRVLFTVVLALCASLAFADCEPKKPLNKFYVGGDYQLVNMTPAANYYVIRSNTGGLSLFGGYRWNELGAEVGYSFNYNTYLDAVFYYDVAKSLDLKGLVGLGLSSSTVDHYWYEQREYNLGARIGFGAQYYFNKHWSSNLMYKLQTSDGAVRLIQSVGLGIAYHF